jgi:3-phenylpropionate/trans-cinnamate dioxygenase ferredoxin reductase subunit
VTARHVDHLLIGGGIAAASAAQELRSRGADGSIVLVGRELDAPYHRPPASKEYLRGESSREEALVCEPGWWERNRVELLMRTSVTALDPAARTAVLSTKEELSYGTALLATGAMVRRLAVDGAQLEGIHYLRALGNADAIRADVENADRVVLVGGSYIGCEVAASLTELGKRCTIVMLEDSTLERSFGALAGRFFQGLLEERGIDVLGREEVERFEGDERVARVVTKSGRVLDADAVVAGVGAMPDVMLARKAGLELGSSGGVQASAQLESSAPGLYVAGDICEYDSLLHSRVMRIEHEDVALEQGRTAARNMMGGASAHEAVPYFFSDLSDWASLEYVGPAASWEEEVVRGSLSDGSFSIFYLEQGRVVAALSVGGGDLEHARRLLRSRADVSAQVGALADPDSDLAGIG